MNSIPTVQNSALQWRRLGAQRQLYSTAKKIFGWQVMFSGPLAVVLTFCIFIFPSMKCYVALWGLLVSLCDVFWLTPWQKRLRNTAARVQEMFDCDVLELPWNDLKAGRRPDMELVKEQSEKYKSAAGAMPTLSNWYAKSVGDLPLHIARIACQRSNCWWDSTQRRRYAVIVVSFTAAVFFVVLLLAMSNDFSVEDFILKVIAPLSPALLLGYRQYAEQMEAARRLDKLKEHSERLWNEALAGCEESAMTAGSRNLQDEIFENRTKSPLVFDAVFKRLRNSFEEQMNYGAQQLVDEAMQKMELS